MRGPGWETGRNTVRTIQFFVVLMAVLVVIIPVASEVRANDILHIEMHAHPSGNRVNLSDYVGHVVLVNFWAPWCVPCRYEFPELVALRKRLQPRGLEVLAVTAEENSSSIKRFMELVGGGLPVLVDDDAKLHTMANVEVMPTTLLLDRKGNLIAHFTGFERGAGLKKVEERALLALEGK